MEEYEVGRPRRRCPHYALRTVASSAPEYANHEQDVIRQSFSTGNRTWMKEALPVELAPDSVNQLRRRRIERHRLAEPVPQTWSRMTQLKEGGCGHAFEYMPDPYQKKVDHERESKIRATEKRDKICNHDWRFTSQEKRMKHEPLINDPRSKEPYPYLGGDKTEELNVARTWLRNGSPMGALPGGCISIGSQERAATQLPTETSFLAGKGRGLEDESRGSRMTLPTVVKRLQRRLDTDWEGTMAVVSATEQDLVQVAFHMGTVDSERGVIAYMNVLSKDPELLGALGLRKVSQLWGVSHEFSKDTSGGQEDSDANGGGENLQHTWMFFLLTPKWVRMRPTDAYYTFHPRSQGSAFQLSTAGSSVLLSLGTSVPDPATETSSRRKGTPRGGVDPLVSARGGGGISAVGGDIVNGDGNVGTANKFPSGGAGRGATGSSGVASDANNRVALSVIEGAVSGLPAIRGMR
eukprot:TRINITY_DN67237_c0_g1_i1.p1 TRINITY_DN67237_c0_g1~~TRINITY_DN67237_c0_g1_i1.p1  ORF type:complete len:465 (+),score=43.45 TRINITY_DN67237_c0_g1_i1:160-1554(+)